MSFETRHAARKRLLDRIILAAQVVAALYLATHAHIAWRAYEADGLVAALLTFILLGFGDLYWGLRWAYEGADPWLAAIALAAAALCFASWATRPAFNRWVTRFTADMLEDVGSELGRVRDETETIECNAADGEETPGKSNDGDPPSTGGGARPQD